MAPRALTIPEPCHERWHHMTAAEKGRFCDSCAKEVVDFTQKSHNEILAIYDEHQGNLCGRFRSSQLQHTNLTAGRMVRRFVLALLVAFGPWLFAFARMSDGQLLASLNTEWLDPAGLGEDLELGVSVRDQGNGEPLAGAIVRLQSTEWSGPLKMVTNDLGDAVFELSATQVESAKEITLIVEANGYRTVSMSLGKLNELKSKDLLVPMVTGEQLPGKTDESLFGDEAESANQDGLNVVHSVTTSESHITMGRPRPPHQKLEELERLAKDSKDEPYEYTWSLDSIDSDSPIQLAGGEWMVTVTEAMGSVAVTEPHGVMPEEPLHYDFEWLSLDSLEHAVPDLELQSNLIGYTVLVIDDNQVSEERSTDVNTTEPFFKGDMVIHNVNERTKVPNPEKSCTKSLVPEVIYDGNLVVSGMVTAPAPEPQEEWQKEKPTLVKGNQEVWPESLSGKKEMEASDPKQPDEPPVPSPEPAPKPDAVLPSRTENKGATQK